MNAKFYLTYDFKKIIYQKSNKIKFINEFIHYEKQNSLVSQKNMILVNNIRRYITKTFDNNYQFLFFYLIYLFGSKIGKKLAQKILLKNCDNAIEV